MQDYSYCHIVKKQNHQRKENWMLGTFEVDKSLTVFFEEKHISHFFQKAFQSAMTFTTMLSPNVQLLNQKSPSSP